jgi:hypothetical protein
MNDELIFEILEEEKEVKRKILSFVKNYDKLPTSDDIPHSEYLFGQIPKLTAELFREGYLTAIDVGNYFVDIEEREEYKRKHNIRNYIVRSLF